MTPVLGLRMCQKCGCYEARYEITYTNPDTRNDIILHLCRPCQMMMVNMIERAQGLFKEEEK